MSLSKKITQHKSKNVLVENELNKLKTFDFGYFIGKSHCREDGTQSYLVFQQLYRYFGLMINTLKIFYRDKLKDYLMKILILLI